MSLIYNHKIFMRGFGSDAGRSSALGIKRLAWLFFLSLPCSFASSPCDWTGKWETKYTDMDIYQNGRFVTGVYPGWDAGRIEGTLSDDYRRLDGYWSEEPTYGPPRDTGPLEFTIAEDCKSFTGLWAYDNSDGWVSDWTGTRQGMLTSQDTDAIAKVFGDGILIDEVPIGNNSVAPLQALLERKLAARGFISPGTERKTIVEGYCLFAENPEFLLMIHRERILSDSANLEANLIADLLVLVEAPLVCELLGESKHGPRKTSTPLTAMSVQLVDGAARIENLNAAIPSQVGSPLLTATLEPGAGVILDHDPTTDRTALIALQAPVTVIPVNNAIGALTVPPDHKIVMDSASVTTPVLVPMFESSFEPD